MVVWLHGHPEHQQELGEPMVLKIYDCSFAKSPRKHHQISPWSRALEEKYHQLIIEGKAAEHISRFLSQDDSYEEEDEPQDVAGEEAYLQSCMLSYYSVELEAYETLQALQGKHIPQFHGAVTVPTSSFVLDHDSSNYANAPGILIQYISEFPLSDLALHAPKDSWQSICEEAMKIVHFTRRKTSGIIM